MAMIRQSALRASQRLTRPAQRRFAGHDSHGHHDAEPVKESLGPMLYGTLALIPTTYILWQLAQSSDEDEPFFTRTLRRFDSWQDEYRERNILHANAVQQAADDHILFANSGSHAIRRKVPVRNLESINVYSPQSVQPGWGSINLSKLVEHIQAENENVEAANKARYEKRKADKFYNDDDD